MYPLRYHSISADVWLTKSKDFQILNIGSELMRAGYWITKGRSDLVNSCYDRALELIDLTRSALHRKSELKEMSRAREYLAGLRWQTEKDINANNLLIKCLMLLDVNASDKFVIKHNR